MPVQVCTLPLPLRLTLYAKTEAFKNERVELQKKRYYMGDKILSHSSSPTSAIVIHIAMLPILSYVHAALTTRLPAHDCDGQQMYST